MSFLARLLLWIVIKQAGRVERHRSVLRDGPVGERKAVALVYVGGGGKGWAEGQEAEVTRSDFDPKQTESNGENGGSPRLDGEATVEEEQDGLELIS